MPYIRISHTVDSSISMKSVNLPGQALLQKRPASHNNHLLRFSAAKLRNVHIATANMVIVFRSVRHKAGRAIFQSAFCIAEVSSALFP